ncbi:hypothetical protein CCR75_002699 [Bremia lactucae]|uniref:Uncharacterized protein n=1 Tax=Bremia lactucae TaxID=4779 RepID=A0A976FQX1_BRELC|nr:hypothetical protein CCR75_002699 [Bremia lactucae]
MLVICGQRAGLIASVTHLVYFTTKASPLIPIDHLRRHEHEAITYVVLLGNSKTIGQTAHKMLQRAQKAYADKGFPNEWLHHHKGGGVQLTRAENGSQVC